ncbi:hypothetical protein C0991_001056, partial [Blastosporella zonata]
NLVAGSSVGRQTDFADSDPLSPSTPSGAAGTPSTLSYNLGPPEIPPPKTSASSSSAPSVGSAAGVVYEGPAVGPSLSSSKVHSAQVAGAAALFVLFLTTRALRWALRVVSPAEFLHVMPLSQQWQHGSRACGYQQWSATLAVVHCWHYNKENQGHQ